MKSIWTLVPDLYEQIQKKDGWFSDELATSFATDLSKRLQTQLGEKKEPPRLRLSQMGPRCPKALWHSIHTPELAEPLPAAAEFKYSYGHIIEALAITLAKASGHTVTGEQDAVEVDGIIGHRDCVVDGCVLDVKSTTSLGFPKFRDGTLKNNDDFGYLEQLDGYLCGSLKDDLVAVKDKAYILAIDKNLGKMVLYEHTFRENHIRNRVEDYKRIVALKEPPACNCGTVAKGSSGNIGLDVRASYSPFKKCCFPGLRTFLYSTGPVYLTKVVRLPDVQEVY
jgi:hypothetical protein